ncbi:MAG: mercury resistance system transport protein MerF [Alphaproteobacteria bacterium]|nr:mercury resistance system transport protein MerF [Alphaproteobacteria bacterium]
MNKLIIVGISGTAFFALCCFTPLLVVLFGIVGLLTGYLDYVLLPALIFFIGLTIYAVSQHSKRSS